MIFTISSLMVLAGCIGADATAAWLADAAGFRGGEGDGGCASGVEAASRSHARLRIRI
jgi:hypothetical protein